VTTAHEVLTSRARCKGLNVLLTCALADYGDIGSCRHAVLRVLAAADVPVEQVEVIALVASELMTNAIAYGQPPYRLDISAPSELLEGCAVTVTMTDHGFGEPARRDAQQGDRPGGYGMNLIDAAASAWGVRSAPAGGKEVWAVVTAASARSQNGPT
jgi:anti-sigma regulatory factor (Ser/Thr protein kinase)